MTAVGDGGSGGWCVVVNVYRWWMGVGSDSGWKWEVGGGGDGGGGQWLGPRGWWWMLGE